MKRPLPLLLLAASILHASDAVVSWDPSVGNVAGYRLLETNASGVRLLAVAGTTPRLWTNFGGFTWTSLGAIVSNWDFTVVHRVCIIATNNTTDAPLTNWVDILPTPGPTTPRTVPLSVVVPIPGTAEISTDPNFVEWIERLRFEPGQPPTNGNNATVLVTWLVRPTNTMMLARVKPPVALPPTPASALRRQPPP